MSLQQNLTPALANSIKSSIHSLEVQITLLKTAIGSTDDDIGEEDDIEETRSTKGKKKASIEDDIDEEDEMDAAEDDAPKGRKKNAKAKAEEEDEEDLDEDESDDEDEEDLDEEEDEDESDDEDEEDLDEEEDEEEEAPKKSAKASKKSASGKSKLSGDDVNDACKARVSAEIKGGKTGKEARDVVLKLLKQNFGVTSVAKLDAKDYADVIKTMKTGKVKKGK